MYVGGVPAPTFPDTKKADHSTGVDAIAFKTAIEASAEAILGEEETIQPNGMDLETVARLSIHVSDEETEDERKAKENGETARSDSSAAPSAMEQLRMAQEWLIQNNSVTKRIFQTMQAAGADTTEAATVDAPPVGEVAPTTAEVSGMEAALKPPTPVTFI